MTLVSTTIIRGRRLLRPRSRRPSAARLAGATLAPSRPQPQGRLKVLFARLHHAHDGRLQHQCTFDHDRREGVRPGARSGAQAAAAEDMRTGRGVSCAPASLQLYLRIPDHFAEALPLRLHEAREFRRRPAIRFESAGHEDLGDLRALHGLPHLFSEHRN